MGLLLLGCFWADRREHLSLAAFCLSCALLAGVGGVLAVTGRRRWPVDARAFLTSFFMGTLLSLFLSGSFSPSRSPTPGPVATAALGGLGGVLLAWLLLEKPVALGRPGRGHAWHILVVGNNLRSGQLIDAWMAHAQGTARILGYLDNLDTSAPETRNPLQDGWRFLGDLSAIEDVLEKNVVDEVWITLPTRSCYEKISRVLQACETVGVPVRLPAAAFDTRGPTRVRRTDGRGLREIYYQTTVGGPWQLLIKRLFDVAAATVLLIVLSPVLLACALAVKISSPGPVLFTQVRCGLHGRLFRLLKFRSMVVDAERKKEEVIHLNEVSGPVFKSSRDPRVTAVGRILRRTSLDELPQLVNVLMGHMSLVGPRPPVPSEVEVYEPWQRRRLSVVPGITCIWQVSGRSQIGFEEWMRMDLEYAGNWSLWLDALLLLKTIPAVFLMRGAH